MNSINTNVTRLRWLSDSQRDRLSRTIKDAFAPVLVGWRATGDASNLEVKSVPCVDLSGDLSTTWDISVGGDLAMTWVLSGKMLKQLLQLPLGTVVQGHQSESAIATLEHDFVRALSLSLVSSDRAAAVRVERSNNDRDVGLLVRPFAAREVVALSVDQQPACCWLTLGNSLVDFLVPREAQRIKASLQSRLTAIAVEPVRLTAKLGQVDLPFKELRQLAVGDVLVMQAALSAPVLISNRDGQYIGEGVLGKSDGQRMLRVSAVDRVMQSKSIQPNSRSGK